MRKRIALVFVMVLLLMSVASPLAASDKIPAAGSFTAIVDFNTLTLMPVGANCELVVNGVLNFTGTLEGSAAATTTALVLASCDDVATHPPGTFKDVFKSEMLFTGTVNGLPATSEMTYQGITNEGGAIKAHLLLKNGLKGNLDVDAIVAVGGDYEGFVRMP